ncbi:hypothetical protein BDZ97DRAFT_1917306 [Flammula alnicola]|nr:hypothetical protein BDZ97DRAFT_1917306 [Flammula alnicola]
MQDAPQELLDHIIHFAHDDRSTLCSARLVCHAWNVSARVHVFRRLDLLITETPTPTDSSHIDTDSLMKPNPANPGNIEWGTAKFTRLFQLLHSSPDMAYFVREVIIGNTTQLRPGQWEVYELLFSVILSRLKRVTALYLREVDWCQLSPAFAHSIMGLCQSPNLEHLDVWNCQMPSMEGLLDFLNFSCGLSTLRLSHIRIPIPHDQVSAVMPSSANIGTINKLMQRPRKPLQTLTIESFPLSPIVYAILATTPCSVDVTKLHSLVLNHVNDLPSVRRFLRVAGNSLEYLEMRTASCQSRQLTEHGFINLTLTPRLKGLRLSGLHWTSTIHPADYLQHVFRVGDGSEPSPESHPLECLHIVVNAFKRNTEAFNFSKWRILDDILSGPSFTSLNRVEIFVHVASMRPADVDPTEFIKEFPELHASSKFRVVCC